MKRDLTSPFFCVTILEYLGLEVIMIDDFIEQLVKRQATPVTYAKKAGLIILTLLVIVVTIKFLPSAVIIAAGLMVWLDVFLFGRMNIEYEYVYFEGELDIDRIANQATRKRLFTINVKDMDVIAPTNAQEMLGYQHLKLIDYSTRTPGNKTYEMVVKQGAEKVRVRFEPNENILNAMKNIAPRKVVL